jgi:AcrR family transcriptional regulator
MQPAKVPAKAARLAAEVPARTTRPAAEVPASSEDAEAVPHRRPGRPRSEHADRAILDAALSLFAESGPDGLCMEKVAARAGVGKATIYRRWPGKEELLLDALAALKVPLPAPKGKSVRSDLVALLEAMSKESADPRRARLFALLQGEGLRYPRLMERYIQTVVEPRRQVVRSVLRRGVATGELRQETDVEAALFMLSGAVLARGRYGQAPVEEGYARRVVDELLRGLASR